ncbi:MAG: isoprenylcysteine carboxylmethyltransferase family protein [bacterium]|nr:isoprenylcysteine carboxylmethyltransferase family protein [bacterium]
MRLFILLYGLLAYAGFHAAFLYLIGFVANVAVPTSAAAGGPEATLTTAVLIDVGLILLFGVQHCIMARPWFKRRWTRIIPRAMERSTFVLTTVGVLALMYWQWRPLPDVVWHVEGSWATVLWVLFASGWLVAVVATFQIDHFELFGLRQTIAAFRGRGSQSPEFRAKGFYGMVRHPLMLGMMISFWSVPTMTYGGLVFALTFTVFILVALQIEERDLLSAHGRDYADYQDRVPMLLPLPRSRKPDGNASSSRAAQ